MIKKFKEWISILHARQPKLFILFWIIVANVVLIGSASTVIYFCRFRGIDADMPFLLVVYNTITMILDAGCINNLVADVGQADAMALIICIIVIIIGMVAFTGAVIGYFTNIISGVIDNANNGKKRLTISGHTVILNWNTRASEIVNDLLYCKERQFVVVLVNGRKEEIEAEIEERLRDTCMRENAALKEKGLLNRKTRLSTKHVIYVVREGDIFSSMQLRDICLEKAKSIIILGSDINNTVCKFEMRENADDMSRGNAQTVKTLMQVADITSAKTSAKDQNIIVEISDPWTEKLVNKIIDCKQDEQYCHIVPVPVNKVLGQLLSQFSIMPELNKAYRELFSNQGATFFADEAGDITRQYETPNDTDFIRKYLATHRHAIPLTVMDEKSGYKMPTAFFSCTAEDAPRLRKTEHVNVPEAKICLNPDYTMSERSIVILGHNSKIDDIMRGFRAFTCEWGIDKLKILVIDDEDHLKKANYYENYAFVENTVAAEIYDNEKIVSAIDKFITENIEHDTSVLILSDDSALNEDIDANALANLVYVQEIINNKVRENKNFDIESIDIIVEIIDPKHHDVVNKYGNNKYTNGEYTGRKFRNSNNVIISNRYISKMITQIGEKEDLYRFYTDILTYDEEENEENEISVDESAEKKFESKEIYARTAGRYFTELPGRITVAQLIRGVFEESTKLGNPTSVLGYVKPGAEIVLFEGDQMNSYVELDAADKLIVFAAH